MNPNFDITLSKMALDQLQLLMKEDYTLESLLPRLAISGKGCGGFTYALTFTGPQKEDLVLNFDSVGNGNFKILLDSFTAQYFKRGTIDFFQSETEEGFVITNFDENNYEGKFFNKE